MRSNPLQVLHLKEAAIIAAFDELQPHEAAAMNPPPEVLQTALTALYAYPVMFPKNFPIEDRRAGVPDYCHAVVSNLLRLSLASAAPAYWLSFALVLLGIALEHLQADMDTLQSREP